MSYDVDILSEIEESLEKILNEDLLGIIAGKNDSVFYKRIKSRSPNHL